MKNSKPVWHYHHSEYLVEFPTETLESRHAFIDVDKGENERPLRHRLLKTVIGELPEDLTTAGKGYVKAKKAFDRANGTGFWTKFLLQQGKSANDQLLVATLLYEKVYYINLPAIEALHAVECPDCPWDGRTIFTRDENGVWY